LKSIYEERPWLHLYESSDIEIPLRSVIEAFDEATAKWKKQTAIIFYGRKISYNELREQVDRFASALSELGVKKGDVVAFLLLNCPEYIIAFYGALKVGAIITPISPVYVSSEIKHQIGDSGAEHLICQDIFYDAVKKTGIEFKNVILTNITESLPMLKKMMGKSVLRGVYEKMAAPSPRIVERTGIYKLADLIKRYTPGYPMIQVDPKEDVVVLPYTSGTTGQPKGVMITHYNIIANEAQYYSFFPVFEEGKDVVIAYMPFYHAAGLMTCVVSGIIRGSTLVILTTPDIDDILDSVVTYQVRVFPGSPALYEVLKDHKKTRVVNWKKFKAVITGADMLHEATAKDWENRTGTTLHNIYGMTETTCMSHAEPLGKAKLGSIGIPLHHTMAAILDPDKDEFVTMGEIGEIVVNGPQVTKGYLHNPEATRDCEAIIDNVRWWRTGDLGRMEEDGYFYLYDRKRDLIKYKGLRVFAREVEEVLKNHPQIKEVGVIGEKDIKVGENVKAVVVLESDARGKLSEQDIIEFCQGKLAHYKIPKIVEFASEIPKTDVGKVSRRELREA